VLLALLFVSCVSAPKPPAALRVTIGGQVIDRQFREVVVTLTNAGPAATGDLELAIEVPEALVLVDESHSPQLTPRERSALNGIRMFRYDVAELFAGATVSVHLPFRRQSSSALSGATVRSVVTGRTLPGPVTAVHVFPASLTPE
jgi:hypothetical protein